FFFFFQAEDGIRDFHVTGVQTCALPICHRAPARAACRAGSRRRHPPYDGADLRHLVQRAALSTDVSLADEGALRSRRTSTGSPRSEERRVGKEWRARWSPDQEEKSDEQR